MVLKVELLLMQAVLAIGVLVLLVVAPNFATSAAAALQAKPGCPDRCGDVGIPFPFGMSKDCSLSSEFALTCNNSVNPPQLFLGNQTDGFLITNITMDGQLYTLGLKAQVCYDPQGNRNTSLNYWMVLRKFSISSSENKLVVIGCDSSARLEGQVKNNSQIVTGCTVTCDNLRVVKNNTCAGEGCCQVDIPDGIKNINVTAYSFNNHTKVWDFNPCTYAFLVQENKFSFSSDLLKMPRSKQFPVALEWALDNSTDEQSKVLLSSMCNKDHNSTIVNPDNVVGYRCRCMQGYGGNPYLQNGCQDIDECQDKSLNDCLDNQHCINLRGSYDCFCPDGQKGDGRKSRKGCSPNQISIALVIIGVTSGVTVIFIILTFTYCRIQRRKFNKRKEKFFIDNGGLMLQNLMASDGKRDTKKVRIFKEDELMKATNNFNKNAIVGQGGFGNVYKGTIDTEDIAIKKSKVVDYRQIEQFINEVRILSQINHPNVVKLVGCCLETEVPLLVYEFVENKTLEHHIVNEPSTFPWEARLRIAAETAGAIAHMHEAPRHIIHRDIKPANILLDNSFTAKVSDFGASRLVPLDQSQLSTVVQGTYGYLDPEYSQTGLLNDKSDVYGFGVILAELLIGETVISFKKKNEVDRNNLVMHFKLAFKDDRLFDILDKKVRDDEEIKMQLKEVAKVARQCLSKESEKRPTMMQVKTWLDELRSDKYFQIVQINAAGEEDTEPLLGIESNFFECSASATSHCSIENQSLRNLPDGR